MDWTLNPTAPPSTPAAFVVALRSLGSHCYRSIGHVVNVLMPVAVTDGVAFAARVLRALAAE